MAVARERLGSQANAVTWITADLLTWNPPRPYDIWHDRAVLHFLTDAQDQRRYQHALRAATHPGSRIIIGVFGPEGPQQCSGLAVQRYDAAGLTALLGTDFDVTSDELEMHHTPNGSAQQFQWIAATRIG